MIPSGGDVFLFMSFFFVFFFLSLSVFTKLYASKSIGVDFHNAEKIKADVTCKIAIG